MNYPGSCHCRTVTFTVEAPEHLELVECNCSVCRKSGFLHLIVAKEGFRLLSGGDNITTYTFNSHEAKHTFCKSCGVKAFYIPRSHPEGISINANCLDTAPKSQTVRPFDGQNWEQNIAALKGGASY